MSTKCGATKCGGKTTPSAFFRGVNTILKQSMLAMIFTRSKNCFFGSYRHFQVTTRTGRMKVTIKIKIKIIFQAEFQRESIQINKVIYCSKIALKDTIMKKLTLSMNVRDSLVD